MNDPKMTDGIKLSLMMPESRARLEHFITARNLRYPRAFPYYLAMPHAVVVEVLDVWAKPLRDSSASKLRLTAKLRVSVHALATRYIDDPGQERNSVRTLPQSSLIWTYSLKPLQPRMAVTFMKFSLRPQRV